MRFLSRRKYHSVAMNAGRKGAVLELNLEGLQTLSLKSKPIRNDKDPAIFSEPAKSHPVTKLFLCNF